MANMFVAVHGRWEIPLVLCLFWSLVGVIRYYQECKDVADQKYVSFGDCKVENITEAELQRRINQSEIKPL